MEEANGYTCTVWDDGEGQRYWLYHLDLQVRIAVEDGSTDIVYDLIETYRFVPETEFVPRVSVEYPLKVSGVGAIGIGDRLVLTASGDGFTGWYSGDELLTEDRTLVVERADPTGTYEARAADGYLVLDPGTETLDSYGFGSHRLPWGPGVRRPVGAVPRILHGGDPRRERHALHGVLRGRGP